MVDDPELKKIVESIKLTALGIKHGQQGNFDKSINALREAIKITPDSDAAYIPLAMAYRGKGMLEEALEILHQVENKSAKEKSSTMDFDLYFTFATIYLRKGDKTKTIEYAKKAMEANSNPKTKKQIDEAIQSGLYINEEQLNRTPMIEALNKIIKECEEQ